MRLGCAMQRPIRVGELLSLAWSSSVRLDLNERLALCDLRLRRSVLWVGIAMWKRPPAREAGMEVQEEVARQGRSRQSVSRGEFGLAVSIELQLRVL